MNRLCQLILLMTLILAPLAASADLAPYPYDPVPVPTDPSQCTVVALEDAGEHCVACEASIEDPEACAAQFSEIFEYQCEGPWTAGLTWEEVWCAPKPEATDDVANEKPRIDKGALAGASAAGLLLVGAGLGLRRRRERDAS